MANFDDVWSGVKELVLLATATKKPASTEQRGVQTPLVTDVPKAFVEVHEVGRFRNLEGVGSRRGLSIFIGSIAFNSGGFLD